MRTCCLHCLAERRAREARSLGKGTHSEHEHGRRVRILEIGDKHLLNGLGEPVCLRDDHKTEGIACRHRIEACLEHIGLGHRSGCKLVEIEGSKAWIELCLHAPYCLFALDLVRADDKIDRQERLCLSHGSPFCSSPF